MPSIICELCGSHDFIKDGDYFVCQNCDTKYTPESAKKLIGTVKLDKSEDVDNSLTLARRAKESGNIKQAAQYYQVVLDSNPNDWEAYFFSIYYSSIDCRVMDIVRSANDIKFSLNNTISLILELSNEDAIKQAIEEVRSFVWTAFNNFALSSSKAFSATPTLDSARKEFGERMHASTIMVLELGDIIEEKTNCGDIAAQLWYDTIVAEREYYSNMPTAYDFGRTYRMHIIQYGEKSTNINPHYMKP